MVTNLCQTRAQRKNCCILCKGNDRIGRFFNEDDTKAEPCQSQAEQARTRPSAIFTALSACAKVLGRRACRGR